MWKRNLLFLGLVLGAGAALWANLLPTRLAPPSVGTMLASASITVPGPAPTDDNTDSLGEIVGQVNEVFRAEWSSLGIAAAPRAAELAALRRLTLALTGTIPSLEEIRQFEA